MTNPTIGKLRGILQTTHEQPNFEQRLQQDLIYWEAEEQLALRALTGAIEGIVRTREHLNKLEAQDG